MESRNDNNFDFLRLLAATAVIITHSYALLGLPEHDFLWKITNGVTSFSRVGVWIFFVISGYLITLSALRSNSLKEYALKRIARIFPALLVVVTLTVLVVGPLLSTVPLINYFQSAETWNYFKTLTLYGVRMELPGMFLDNPYPRAVNGSLWTLSYEFTLYLIPALFIFIKGKMQYLRAFLLCLFVVLIFTRDLWMPIASDISIPFLLLNGGHLVNLGTFFLGGILMALYRDKIPLSAPKALLVTGIFLLICQSTRFGPHLAYIAIPYMVLSVAYAKFSTARFFRYGDISYGMYIYAFLFQQILVQLFFSSSKNPFLFFLCTLVFVIPVAYLSWRLVEKPALQWKKKWNKIAG